MSLSLRIVAAAVGLFALADLVAREQIPGTRISIEPPAGFRAASFPGYVKSDPPRGLIRVKSLSGMSFETITPAYINEKVVWGRTGIVSSEVAELGDRQALVIEIADKRGGSSREQYLVAVLGDDQDSAAIVGRFTAKDAGAMETLVTDSVRSSRWIESPESGRTSELPFSVDEVGISTES